MVRFCEQRLSRAHLLHRQSLENLQALLKSQKQYVHVTRVQLRLLHSIVLGVAAAPPSAWLNRHDAVAIGDSSVTTASTASVPMSALVDAQLDKQIHAASAASRPAFTVASHCQQLGDLLFLIAINVHRQEQQAVATTGAGSAAAGPTSARAMFADAARYLTLAHKQFEIVAGSTGDATVTVAKKLDQIAQIVM